MDRWVTFVRVGAEMLSALGTALFLILDVAEIQPVKDIKWQWLALASFLLFVVLMYERVWSLNQETTRLKEARPALQLGEPFLEPEESLTRTHMVRGPWSHSESPPPAQRLPYEQHQTALWRIPVANKGGYAPDVSVKLVNTEPRLAKGLPRGILHLAGDNPEDRVSFVQSFPLHKDDTAVIDVISFTKTESPRYFLHKVASEDAAEETQLEAGAYVFTIGAFAGNVSDSGHYRVDRDPLSGRLTMTRLSSPHERGSPR